MNSPHDVSRVIESLRRHKMSGSYQGQSDRSKAFQEGYNLALQHAIETIEAVLTYE